MDDNIIKLKDKLTYILKKYIDGGSKELALNTFGYERENAVTNLCSKRNTSTIRKIHMESIQTHHKIPLSIWDDNVPFNKKIIDNIISDYREELQKEELERDDYLKYKKNLEQSSLAHLEIDTIFQKREKLFDKLKGLWYGYLYASNPMSVLESEGIWIVPTTIHKDYSVVDAWDNVGYLKIGKHESLIIKESYDNDDLTVIRFPNRQVPSQHMRFVIVSNQNNTIHEMVNYGFYSRTKYSPKEAKVILGEINKVQLKLDLNFNDRINQLAIVPKK